MATHVEAECSPCFQLFYLDRLIYHFFYVILQCQNWLTCMLFSTKANGSYSATKPTNNLLSYKKTTK